MTQTDLAKKKAEEIANDFQYLIGNKFKTPHGTLAIDTVEALEGEDGFYKVFVIHDAFKKGSIPEFFSFQNPKMLLTDYLSETDTSFKKIMTLIKRMS